MTFRQGDVRDLDLPGDSFDVAWTRDTVLYVADKCAVWRELHRLLRPGGRLYVADFCLGSSPASPELQEYLARAGYHLTSTSDYRAAVEAGGFADVRCWDETAAFQRSLVDEVARLEGGRATFLAAFSAEDYRYLVDRWTRKIDFCRRGEMAWGWFLARKPAPAA